MMWTHMMWEQVPIQGLSSHSGDEHNYIAYFCRKIHHPRGYFIRFRLYQMLIINLKIL